MNDAWFFTPVSRSDSGVPGNGYPRSCRCYGSLSIVRDFDGECGQLCLYRAGSCRRRPDRPVHRRRGPSRAYVRSDFSGGVICLVVLAGPRGRQPELWSWRVVVGPLFGVHVPIVRGPLLVGNIHLLWRYGTDPGDDFLACHLQSCSATTARPNLSPKQSMNSRAACK